MLAPILPSPIIPSCMIRCSLCIDYSSHCGSQPCHGGGYAFAAAKNRRSSHQNVGASRNCQPSSRHIDASVHLQVASGLDLVDHLADTLDLRERGVKVQLMAKDRIDRHDQLLADGVQD